MSRTGVKPAQPDARPPSRWPLLLLALPAGVATWSGWVGLGEKTGFGMVTPLPGIADDFQINTAITLPIGVETYAAYALGAWLSHGRLIGPATRAFAKWSAIGSLVIGSLGQVAYHLLEVFDHDDAPAWITTIVSCLPVLVLGMGAALGHLLARDAHTAPATTDAADVTEATSTETGTGTVIEVTAATPAAVPAAPEPPALPPPPTPPVSAPAAKKTGAKPRAGKKASAARSDRPARVAVAAVEVEELMPLGWRIAADLEAAGAALTRDSLAAALRQAGESASNGRVGALLARLKTEAPADPTDAVPTDTVPAAASAAAPVAEIVPDERTDRPHPPASVPTVHGPEGGEQQ